MPTGTYAVGDVLVMFASATAPGGDLTLSGGTGTWTINAGTGTDGGNNYTWSTGARAIVVTHTFANGDGAPTINAPSTNGITWRTCPYWGVNTATPIDAMAATTTSGSATVTFPSVTPTRSNDELFLLSAGKFGSSPTYSSVSTLTTCGKTTDQVFIGSYTASSPDQTWYQLNQGPCNLTATSAASIVASSSADNIGISVLARSVALAAAPPVRSPLSANMAGIYDFNTQAQNRTSIDPADSKPFVDGMTAYQTWINLEPNACDEYNFDWMDNTILNAHSR
jgi:hypothetical protein